MVLRNYLPLITSAGRGRRWSGAGSGTSRSRWWVETEGAFEAELANMPLADLLSNSFPSHLSPSTSCLDQVAEMEDMFGVSFPPGR